MTIKTYSELVKLKTFEERFKYLKLDSIVGRETFGHDRYLNQVLYKSDEWKKTRRDIFIRDNGCDLASEGFEIHGRYIIHHINPITIDDVLKRNTKIFDLENLVTTIHNTHQAIHYGNEDLLVISPIQRTKNDTVPWK